MTRRTEGPIKLKDAARTTRKIDPGQVQSPLTRTALDKWNALRGTRRFPSRKDASPRELSSLLRNIALIRVLDDGNDFQFRILGDAIVQAQSGLRTGMTTRELEERYPDYGVALRQIYQDIYDTRAPQAYRGYYELQSEHNIFYHETLLLPLGADESAVDHILVVGVYSMKPDAPPE